MSDSVADAARQVPQAVAGRRRGLALLAAFALGGCSAPEEGGPPRHALLVTVSALRADRLSCYLAPRPTGAELGTGPPGSPTLDDLAAQGVLFATAFTPSPHGVEALSAALLGSGGRQPPGPTPAERLADAGFETAAFVAGNLPGPGTAIGRGFATLRRTAEDDEALAAAVAWLRRPELGSRPLFLWLHLAGTLRPWDPAPLAGVDGAPVDFVRLFEVASGGVEAGAEAVPRALDRYDGEVARVAALLRRFVADYAESGRDSGRWGDTLLVVAGLQGTDLGSSDGEREPGPRFDEGLLQVPLIFHHPPSIPGRRVLADLVATTDVMPTVLDALGRPLRGRSLLGRLTGRAPTPLDEAVLSSWSDGLHSLRTERWRLTFRSSPAAVAGAGTAPAGDRVLYEVPSIGPPVPVAIEGEARRAAAALLRDRAQDMLERRP